MAAVAHQLCTMQTLPGTGRVLHVRPVVLTVDDADSMRDALRVVLEDEYDVIEAQNGAAALDLVRERRVDLVLLDVLMPGVDGLEVLARARSIRLDLKVVLVTAVDSASMAVQAMKLGALDYLTKPFEIAVLRNIVSRVLAAPRVTVIGDDVGLRAAVAVFLRVLTGGDVTSYSSKDFWLRHRPDEGGELIDLTATTDVPRLLSAFTGIHIATDITPRCVEQIGRTYAVATVRSTAVALGVRADHVTERFRVDTGMGVKDFISRVRIEIASYLLAQTRDKQHVIAERVGLYDAAHLSRLFQHYLGHRPGVSRKQDP